MTHRVGTLTLGITMLAIGILYFVRIFWSGMDAMWIYRFWPVIFISLGVEILLANAQKGVQIVYDKAGIFLVFVLTFFAFFMAAAQRAVELEWGEYFLSWRKVPGHGEKYPGEGQGKSPCVKRAAVKQRGSADHGP